MLLAGDGIATGDNIGDLNIQLAYKTFNVGNNVITITADNDNYDFTLVEGTLAIDGADDIELIRVAKADIASATVASTIESYNGQPVNVTIKYNDAEAYNTLKANRWYTMVLPFETDAKMISDAFGYAIVDTMRKGNLDVNRTYFDLVMSKKKIAANTPFLLKVWDDIDMASTGVQFNGVTIVNPANEDALTARDDAGNRFIGSYTGIDNLGAAGNDNLWWYSLANGELAHPSATAYLRQLSAYIVTVGDSKAHEFIIEEFGGGTTSIRGINVDSQNVSSEGWYNLNGVKLQNAPTEKGIYIQNGKKIVIK